MMKNVFAFISLATCLVASSCISATVEVDSACSSKTMMLPGVPPTVSDAIGKQDIVRSAVQDMSKMLSQASDVGDVTLSSASVTVTALLGDLSFVESIDVSLHSDVLGDLLVGSSTINGRTKSVPIVIIAPHGKLLEWLRSGPVTATLTMPGTAPTQDTNLDLTICVGVSAHVEKSVSDISK